MTVYVTSYVTESVTGYVTRYVCPGEFDLIKLRVDKNFLNPQKKFANSKVSE